MAAVAPISWRTSVSPPCLLLSSPCCGRDELRRAPLPLLSSPSDPPSTRSCHDAGISTTVTLPRQRVRPPLGPHRVATTATATSLPPHLLAPWTSRPPQSRHSRATTTTACSGSHPSIASNRAHERSCPFSSYVRCCVARAPPRHGTPDQGQGHSCPASLSDESWTAMHPRGIKYWRTERYLVD